MDNSLMLSSKLIYFPRNILLSYLVLTIFMFIVSPWEWEVQSVIVFYFYNILYLISFFLGYKYGVSKYKIFDVNKIFYLKKVISISLIVSIFFIYPKFLFNLKVSNASIGEIFDSILLGIFSPSIAYAAKHQSEYEGFLTLSNPLVLFYFVTLPLQYIVIPLAIYHWKALKLWQKISYLVIAVTNVLSFIAIGTNKGVFDYVILLPVMALILDPRLISFKYFLLKRIKLLFVLSLVLSLGIFYFSVGNQGRKKNDFGYDYSVGKIVNRDATIMVFIPEIFENTYIALDSYLTQGYYAMGLAIDLDFVWTYGLGHNNFFISLGEKVFGKNSIWSNTYQVRVENIYEYSSTGKWHTAYVWLANDFTFFGVSFIIFLIGYFFSHVWLDSLLCQNVFAIVLLPLFFTMILYFPANNQVLGFQGSSITFWVLFIFWYSSRKKMFVLV
ncbi:hypothetical protein JYB62_02320 [Algoriphagus lutimaris]|uniref:hypothetical protein n=1 Tax=Algoriphagus lutimaris TaxID=613197 RepID=UPI00196B1683|nr:hypothetical protein [Algoriphagus lutimaris]MBN3518825.1 hypothetical protein [Algoriphagus lutimaris]